MKTIVEVSEELGLCLTCAHHASCTTRQSYKGKIFQCEEFDTREPQRPVSRMETEVMEAPIQYSDYKGLCMNCDLAHSCSLPKASAGVWHCNEYK